jgi:hypothetical protein
MKARSARIALSLFVLVYELSDSAKASNSSLPDVSNLIISNPNDPSSANVSALSNIYSGVTRNDQALCTVLRFFFCLSNVHDAIPEVC